MNQSIRAEKESISKVEEMNHKIIRALVRTIDAKDRYTNGHSLRVAEYSKEIARRMKKSEKEQETIYYAGLLHDVGKIRIPVEVINKPGKLTDEEYEQIKIHPITSYHILKDIFDDVQVKNGAGGTLNIRKDSKKGDVISKCDLPSAGDASKWIDVRCSNMPELKGVQDFYLTAENLGDETLVGNIKFDEGVKDSTDAIRRIDGRDGRALRAGNVRALGKGYRDLKGRRYEKLIRYRVMF